MEHHPIVDRIISLLSSGLTVGTVSRACGVQPSYVEEIQQQFAEQISLALANAAVKEVSTDNTIDSLRQTALDRMSSLLPLSTKLSDVTRAFIALDGAKKKTALDSQERQTGGAVIVEINLPEQAIPSLKVSATREVVEIGGRSMTTLPAKQLEQLVAARAATRLLETVDSPRKRNNLLDKL